MFEVDKCAHKTWVSGMNDMMQTIVDSLSVRVDNDFYVKE